MSWPLDHQWILQSHRFCLHSTSVFSFQFSAIQFRLPLPFNQTYLNKHFNSLPLSSPNPLQYLDIVSRLMFLILIYSSETLWITSYTILSNFKLHVIQSGSKSNPEFTFYPYFALLHTEFIWVKQKELLSISRT